ncbi:MAG: tetratricopeptide repeat protein [Nitrosopumilus sp.]|nr:tetratricopeptide repeat protein [Nitrosopumilus sp.]
MTVGINFGSKIVIGVIAMVVIMGLGAALFSPSNEYLFGTGPDSDPDPYLVHLVKAQNAESCSDSSCKDDVLNHYKMALEINPEGRGALDGILSTLIELHNFDEAYTYYQTLSKLYPDRNFVETFYAVPLFLGLKQYDHALNSSDAYLEKIQEDKSEFTIQYALALRDKARSLIGLERYDESIAVIEESYYLDPSGHTLVYKGVALSKQEKYHDALKVFDMSKKNGGGGLLLSLEQGIALWNVGRYDEAKDILDNIESSNPESYGFLECEVLSARKELQNLVNSS